MKEEEINNLSGQGDFFFSAKACDCCGSTLAGDRTETTGYNPKTKEVQKYDGICVDCIYYVKYGTLDDTTMLEVDASSRLSREETELKILEILGDAGIKSEHLYTKSSECPEHIIRVIGVDRPFKERI